MKTLITLGIGIALGFAFKKPKRTKLIVVNDYHGLNEHVFGDEAKEVLKKYIRNNKPNL